MNERPKSIFAYMILAVALGFLGDALWQAKPLLAESWRGRYSPAIEGGTIINQTINNLTSTTIDATTIQNVTNVYTTNIRATGKATIYVDDPPFFFDQATAGESDWWLGVNGDAQGDDDDPLVAGTGSTFGTNTRWYVEPAGTMYSLPAALPAPDVSGEFQWDSDDFGVVHTDGTNDFYVSMKLKEFSMSIYDPDTIQSTEDAVPVFPVEAEAFPNGITLVDVGIKTDASSTYAVNFEEWTSPTDGSPSTIEAVTTSASTEAEDDGTLSDSAIAAGSIIYVDLPATDIDILVVWGTYYVNVNN